MSINFSAIKWLVVDHYALAGGYYMANNWKEAHKAVRGSYDIFKPSTLSGVDSVQKGNMTSRDRKNHIHKTRAKIIGANLLTLGLSNLYWLGKSKSSLDKKEFNKNLSLKVGQWSDRVAPNYGIDGRDLSNYLEFKLGIKEDTPDVNPISSTAFAFGWNDLRQDHSATLAEFGIS